MDADQAIEAAEVNIEFYEYQRASKEPPWDGFCGLVKVCDDPTFKEHGVIRRTRAPGPTQSRATSFSSLRQPPPHVLTPSITHAHPPAPQPPAPPPASSTAPAPASPHHLSPAPAHPAPAHPDPQDDAPLPDWVLEYVLAPPRSSSPSSRPPSSGGEALSSGSSASSEVQQLLSMVQTEVDLDDKHQAVFTAPDNLLSAMPSPPKGAGPAPPGGGS